MSFKDFISENYVVFFELFGLLITLFISAYIPKSVKKHTRIAIALMILCTIVYYAEARTQEFEHLSMWRPFLTACKYTLFPLILLLIIFLVAAIQKSLSKKTYVILSLPLAICAPLFFTSQWTHLVCYFTEDNVFQGGPLRYLPYILFGLYLVYFSVQNIRYLKKYSFRSRIIAIYISAASFIGVLIFMIFGISDNYLPIFTSSITFYYLFLYIHMAGVDPLTGLINRQSYYQDIQIKGDKVTVVVSIDMNYLKQINDNYGHDAGDKALKAVASAIISNAGSRCTCYRIGGDEFIIFYYGASEEYVLSHIEMIKKEVSNASYSCAIGYALKDNNLSLEEVIREADKKMYENKAEIKQNKDIDSI